MAGMGARCSGEQGNLQANEHGSCCDRVCADCPLEGGKGEGSFARGERLYWRVGSACMYRREAPTAAALTAGDVNDRGWPRQKGADALVALAGKCQHSPLVSTRRNTVERSLISQSAHAFASSNESANSDAANRV